MAHANLKLIDALRITAQKLAEGGTTSGDTWVVIIMEIWNKNCN
jgi:hypothetical protein